MAIKTVKIGVNNGDIYTVGQKVNGVIIDDIIQNTITGDIFCYDSGSNLIVAIRDGVPVVVEYVGAE